MITPGEFKDAMNPLAPSKPPETAAPAPADAPAEEPEPAYRKYAGPES